MVRCINIPLEGRMRVIEAAPEMRILTFHPIKDPQEIDALALILTS